MSRYFRHRYAVALPFLLVILLTIVGGRINTVDARGRVLDDTTDLPVPGIAVSYGTRTVITAADGSYALPALPRGARLQAQAPGYSRSSASADATELRLLPLTITFEVKDETTGKGIDTPEARQPAEVRIGTGSSSGEMVVGPYPVRDKPVIICAKGFESKEVLTKGVLMEVALKPGGTGCPPLPSSPPPAQVPSASPSAGPSGSAFPSASPSP